MYHLTSGHHSFSEVSSLSIVRENSPSALARKELIGTHDALPTSDTSPRCQAANLSVNRSTSRESERLPSSTSNKASEHSSSTLISSSDGSSTALFLGVVVSPPYLLQGKPERKWQLYVEGEHRVTNQGTEDRDKGKNETSVAHTIDVSSQMRMRLAMVMVMVMVKGCGDGCC